MKIKLTKLKRQEMVDFLDNNIVPNRLESSISISNFRKNSTKFVIESENNDRENIRVLKFKVGTDRNLRFFTVEESKFETDAIRLEHVCSCHATRDRLFPDLQAKIYGSKKVEIQRVVDSCEVCQARRNPVTRPIIQPIVCNYSRRE